MMKHSSHRNEARNSQVLILSVAVTIKWIAKNIQRGERGEKKREEELSPPVFRPLHLYSVLLYYPTTIFLKVQLID